MYRVLKRDGGTVEFVWNMSTGAVHNDKKIVKRFEETVRNSCLNVQDMPQRMSSEDFGWYLTKIPGMIFRFGTRNEKLGCTALAHRNDFCIDEEGMKAAIQAFCDYILKETI